MSLIIAILAVVCVAIAVIGAAVQIGKIRAGWVHPKFAGRADDFLAAKRRSETEPMLPVGTRIAFTSGPAYQDHNRIWAALDKVLAKYPDMVLFHGGNPTGGEHIASLWARARKITHVPFRPDWERFKKAAPFRRNDQMLEVLPKAVVACPGNGINANLVDKARKMGISVWAIE